MGSRILKCSDCGRYTLSQACPNCGKQSHTPHPSRFSPEDRYGKYRRKLIAMTKGGD